VGRRSELFSSPGLTKIHARRCCLRTAISPSTRKLFGAARCPRVVPQLNRSRPKLSRQCVCTIERKKMPSVPITTTAAVSSRPAKYQLQNKFQPQDRRGRLAGCMSSSKFMDRLSRSLAARRGAQISRPSKM